MSNSPTTFKDVLTFHKCLTPGRLSRIGKSLCDRSHPNKSSMCVFWAFMMQETIAFYQYLIGAAKHWFLSSRPNRVIRPKNHMTRSLSTKSRLAHLGSHSSTISVMTACGSTYLQMYVGEYGIWMCRTTSLC